MKYFYPAVMFFLMMVSTMNAQVCSPGGNIAVYVNYDGGVVNINCDVNIPNLKIGVCTYEAAQINIVGPYAGNVTEVIYAGYIGQNNTCGYDLFTTTVTGVSPTIVDVLFAPPASTSDANGYPYIICGYSCESGSQGGCNTSSQIAAYFTNVFGGTLYQYYTQYGCWMNQTYNLSAGANCCPTGSVNPPQANFYIFNQSMCTGGCTDVINMSSGDIENYDWYMPGADIENSTAYNPGSICYSTPGTYEIFFTVSNSFESHTYSQEVVVSECQMPTCFPSGNIAVYSNYNGGDLTINCDQDINDLKIGICTYEAVHVHITGPYASNVTGVIYAGYNATNDNCGLGIFSSSVTGVSPGIVDIQVLPNVTLDDPNGPQWMLCGPTCDPDPGDCNSPIQIEHFFETNFGGELLLLDTYQDCWYNDTRNMSDGGGCCPGEAPQISAFFSVSDDIVCQGQCISIIDQSAGFPSEWSWSITGANIGGAVGADPGQICFLSAGMQQITLIVSNGTGSDSYTGFVEVIACGILGCTYPDALNYDSLATVDDGSCVYAPCINTCPADLDGNGFVNVADLLEFMSGFGVACPE